MPQSNVIAGALLIGFVVFITVKGELPEYIGLFTLKRKEPKHAKGHVDSNGGGFDPNEIAQMFGDGSGGDSGSFSSDFDSNDASSASDADAAAAAGEASI